MAESSFKASNVEEVSVVAEKVIRVLKPGLVLLVGEMGLGKTTLIKALCEALGVEETVSSPTFSIVNEYQGAAGEKIYHFDWYRIEDEEEALAIGLDEYLADGDWLFMEWPEKISNLLPLDYQLISLTADADGVRQISLRTVHE